MNHIIHDPSINDDWHSKWLPALDCLDTGILVDHPGLCVAHRALWEASFPLAEKCAVSFITKAHPTRWCADLTEDHTCPCASLEFCIWP